jgi:hypothetical protein
LFVILYTVGRNPWTGDQPVSRPLPAHTSIPQVAFETTTPVFERAKMVHALDRAATLIGIHYFNKLFIISKIGDNREKN